MGTVAVCRLVFSCFACLFLRCLFLLVFVCCCFFLGGCRKIGIELLGFFLCLFFSFWAGEGAKWEG